MRLIVRSERIVLLLYVAVIREVGILSAASMLQRFNRSSEVDFALEELFTRDFVQLICRVSIRRYVCTAWVIKASWMIMETLHILSHFVTSI